MTKDLTKGPIFPVLIEFTAPLIAGNLLQLTYNAVDSMIVGRYVGKEALAAVGTSNPLMTLVLLFHQRHLPRGRSAGQLSVRRKGS